MIVGAIADDFTGATDVAVAFRRSGLRVAVVFGPPDDATRVPDVDVVVVALKSRTSPAAVAVAQSVSAARWLRARGAQRLYFKFCSTFDSTPDGNIGPVADALADLVDASLTVVVPSSPEHDRTQYHGHLFAGRLLLSESSMRHHPLTPMTDSSVPRLLSAQTRRDVDVIDLETVRLGEEAIRARLAGLRSGPTRYVVVDAITAADLRAIGAAVRDDVLLTGAAGLAEGLGFALAGTAIDDPGETLPQQVDPIGMTRGVVLAGSCSQQTLAQIAAMKPAHPSHRIDALRSTDPRVLADEALAWFDALPADSSPLIYSSSPPDELERTQRILGPARASAIFEETMGAVARGLAERGIARIVVAGGETSGSVVTALGVHSAVIGEEEAPGVPWLYLADGRRLALLLKSGNFGDLDLFERALGIGEVVV